MLSIPLLGVDTDTILIYRNLDVLTQSSNNLNNNLTLTLTNRQGCKVTHTDFGMGVKMARNDYLVLNLVKNSYSILISVKNMLIFL